MAAPPTQTVWITRNVTTVRHIRGLLEGLESKDALNYTEVKVMALTEDSYVEFAGQVFHYGNLPPQGILIVGEG